MKKTTIGVFHDRLKTEMIVKELHASGISNDDISCIYTDRDGEIKDSQTGDKIEIGAVKGVVAGGVLGALAGLVVANGIIPGLGTLFVAGPLVEILGLGLTGAVATTAAGAATGAIAGGLVGGLVELGVSDEDAGIYEEHIKKGRVVIITRTDNGNAKDVLKKNGADDIREYIES